MVLKTMMSTPICCNDHIILGYRDWWRQFPICKDNRSQNKNLLYGIYICRRRIIIDFPAKSTEPRQSGGTRWKILLLFLRRHYPDQVLRVESDAALLSA